MKRMAFIFNGIDLPKIKSSITVFLIFFLFPQANAQVVVEQDFEVACKNYSNAFYEGSIPGWVSTHGTPDTYSNYVRITPFEGERYVHLYIEKAGDCSKSPDRGEGIALNYSFEPGQTYKLKYAMRGQVNLAQWILRSDPLQNQNRGPNYCGGGEIVPPAQPQDLILERKTAVDLEDWRVYEIEFTLPYNSAFSQLWFRASNLYVAAKEKRTHLYLDAVTLRKTCEGVDCEDGVINQYLTEKDISTQSSSGDYLKPLVFPNPSSNKLTMQLEAGGPLTVEVDIYDAKGSLVKSFPKKSFPEGKYYKKWQAGKELGNGIFFIYFKTNYGTFHKRIVLQDRL